MVVDFPKPVVHGGTGKREREKTGKNLLDFSASLNPLPPRFAWSCDPADLAAYPDNGYCRLKERIADVFHRDPGEICVGNGSIELIRVFCSVAFSGKKTCFIRPPTFGEYDLSARLAGASAAKSPQSADVTFVCNPNNPTGELASRPEMLAHARTAASRGGILFADEAFIELADPAQSLVGEPKDSLFVLRSLTKCFAVPGIRFGYGFGDPDLIAKIETARPPWSINAYAEAFALAAFSHMDELETSRAYIDREREHLRQKIQNLGLQCRPSSVNYLLVDCARDAGPLSAALESHGVIVRDCTSFGLPASIRVAVRTREENALLVEALAACVR